MERGPEQWGLEAGWGRGGGVTRTNFTFLLIPLRANPRRHTAGKWDTELTLSHLCLSRALMLTHRKGDNETDKEELQGETSPLRLWVTGSRESALGAPGSAVKPPAFPSGTKGNCQNEEFSGPQKGLTDIRTSFHPTPTRPSQPPSISQAG